MMEIEEVVESFSDEELKQAYCDMEKYIQLQGLSEDSIVNKIHQEILINAEIVQKVIVDQRWFIGTCYLLKKIDESDGEGGNREDIIVIEF